MTQTVLVIPEITEGPWVEPGLDRPLRFSATVGEFVIVHDLTNKGGPAIPGWEGYVTAGQDQFLRKRVVLTPRREGYNGAVVARIFSDDGDEREIFSAICRVEGNLN